MTDRFEPAYTTIIVATKSDKRWFDLDAVREAHKESNHRPSVGSGPPTPNRRDLGDGVVPDSSINGGFSNDGNPAGAPPLDYWKLPPDLMVQRVLRSMLPERVCRTCGEPSRRIVDSQRLFDGEPVTSSRMSGRQTNNNGRDLIDTADGAAHDRFTTNRETLGWSDCGHDNWRAGMVLDPFQLPGDPAMSARYIIGDVFDTLATLPDNSVDLVFTSPPFLALRSYLPADDPLKGKEIGSEATPADFLDTLLGVVEACDRVLAPHGSLVFELGDTYAGSGGAGGDYAEDGLRAGQPRFRQGYQAVGHDGPHGGPYKESYGPEEAFQVRSSGGYGWPLPKSLSGIPTLFAWSLAYGRNLLRPERETPRWRIRNVIVWARPNPPVGALGDKFRPATSYLTVACKSDKRWFDLDAVRTMTETSGQPLGRGWKGYSDGADPRGDGYKSRVRDDGAALNNPAGAPPLDYWEIPTQPYPGAHYATMPAALIVKPVAAMAPAKVCETCGEPSRRITETERVVDGVTADETVTVRRPGRGSTGGGEYTPGRYGTIVETLGWSDCGHNDWRAGCVLDPFAGSGTTLAVATGHGRDAIGVDIDARNAELALERVGPLFMTVEHLADARPFTPTEVVETDLL